MKRWKESIAFIVICVILIFSIFSARAKIVGKSSEQVTKSVKFLNNLKDIEAINDTRFPKDNEFKEISISNGSNSNRKYTVVAGDFGIDLDSEYNVIGFLDQSTVIQEKEVLGESKAIINAREYLTEIVDEKIKYNEVKTTEDAESPLYTISFYKYHKKYPEYSNEIIVQINKYTGKLVSYTGYSDNNIKYSSKIEVEKEDLNKIVNGYFEALGLEGKVSSNVELGYFNVEEGQAQLCYIVKYKILDGEEKDKIYRAVINAKDGTVVKHY